MADAVPYGANHPEEIALADDSKKLLANAQFRKVQRAEDGKKAMAEYETDAVAVRAKTARLKELRLAQEAAVAAAAPVAPASKKKPAKPKKAAPGMLSDWLKDQKETGRNN
jgi:hypothetical protein